MVIKQAPEFPLKVHFHETGEEWILEDVDDTACNLEWFDSEDPDENASVIDSLGRAVRLKVRQLVVLTCELEITWTPTHIDKESGLN